MRKKSIKNKPKFVLHDFFFLAFLIHVALVGKNASSKNGKIFRDIFLPSFILEVKT